MRFHSAFVVLFATVLASVSCAPVEEAAAAVLPAEIAPTPEAEQVPAEVESVPVVVPEELAKEVVSSVTPAQEVQDEESEEVTAAKPVEPAVEEPEKVDEKKGRQLEDEDDDEEGDGDHDEEDNDDEDEDENEDEEEERKLPAKGAPPAGKGAQKKKAVVPGKPVPSLAEGVEDDEAEDLGIFEREEPKSDEAEPAEKSSDEKSDEDKDDDDESNEDEERDDPIGPSGLVAEPGSSERGDVDEVAASSPVQNEVSGVEKPLGVAVVQPEENSDPVMPIIVEETAPAVDQSTLAAKVESAVKKQKPKTAQDDDDDDDEEDGDDDDDDDEEARSEKVHRHRARAAYNPSPVLYYYPFPDAPAETPAAQ